MRHCDTDIKALTACIRLPCDLSHLVSLLVHQKYQILTGPKIFITIFLISIGGGTGGDKGGSCPPLADKGGKWYQMPPHFADLVE